MPAGGGPPVQITRQAGFRPVASPEGKWVYYFGAPSNLFRVPVDGGGDSQAPPLLSIGSPFWFDVTASSIYYAGPQDSAGTRPLKKYSLADGKTVELARLEKLYALGFSVSPDERSLLYVQTDLSINDLRLVENFR